jgi:hypothetical protein
MNYEERDGYKELAWDDFVAYRTMLQYAGATLRYLDVSWQQALDHDRGLERMALWHAVVLGDECAEALEPGHELRMWPPAVSARIRYGLQAGIRMVHATLPFTDEERQALGEIPLRPMINRPRPIESDELAAHEPELVERWHQWLWSDELGIPQQTAARLGASMLLAESCVQLRAGIEPILADIDAHPL